MEILELDMSPERSPGFVGVCIKKQDQAMGSLAQGKESKDHTVVDIFVVIALKTINLFILFKREVPYALETVSFIAIVVFVCDVEEVEHHCSQT